MTEAEDAFGFSVGLESLGIYNAQNVRGFSPIAAGNVRIDGLYFDPSGGFQIPSGLASTLVDSIGIKVGISAQGYPFAAPSGIVDQKLRMPADKGGASVVTNFDNFGTLQTEIDGSAKLSGRLSLAYGFIGGHTAYPDGTHNSVSHTESLLARWRPVQSIEIVPFWYFYNDYDDESNVFYQPAGDYLPKFAKPGVFEGPSWTNFRFTTTTAGVLGSARLGHSWLLRLGAFRSLNFERQGFNNLLVNEQPNGAGERIAFADAPNKSRSASGELRLTHSISEGRRLHVFYLSVRERDARREFGGSESFDFGAGMVGRPVNVPRPSSFTFGDLSHDHLQQTTYGVAYDGRWKNVGEIGFGLSKANYRKSTFIPGAAVSKASSGPWLYNVTAAASLDRNITIYAGYARGLEESGIAPYNAENRNAPLPAVITSQKDGGVRFLIGTKVRVVAGLFDLTRPYFGYDSASVYKQVGTVESRGAEFSLSGELTPRLSLVAGGLLRQAKVTSQPGVQGRIGSKAVGLDPHELTVNANWKTKLIKGLELDATLVNRGKIPATTDNLVMIPVKWRLDLGTHYHFKLAGRDATFRIQMYNATGGIGYSLVGAGFYGQAPGRFIQGYLAVDL